MNLRLQFFDYDRCLRHYKERIMNIRQAKIRGERILAKPVLLLTVIDGVEQGHISSNHIELDEWIEKRYNMLMRQYVRGSQFDKITSISNPFWHLQSDGFWHLYADGIKQTVGGPTPSIAWHKEHRSVVMLDEELWILLKDHEMRPLLRDYIIEHKLTNGTSRIRMAAEKLLMLTALIPFVA